MGVLVAGCAGETGFDATSVPLTIKGGTVLDPQGLQVRAEAEVSYTLGFGYVARTDGDEVSCWFARVDPDSEVDTRLWCGPVQVPGTPTTTDWVPVPLKEVERTDAGVRLDVLPPQVPAFGAKSTPVGDLVRTDGRSASADQGVGEAGPDFLAVLPDDGRALDSATGRLRDDQLDVKLTGYARPSTVRTGQGELRAEHGVGLRVVRLEVDRLREADGAFDQKLWEGRGPQPPELSLQVPGRRHALSVDQLPKDGTVLVVYTVPSTPGAEELVLDSVGARPLVQRLSVTDGRTSDGPPALRREPAAQVDGVSAPVRVGSSSGTLAVKRVRVGWQRPVDLGGRYRLVTADEGKALVELRLEGQGLVSVLGAPETVKLLGTSAGARVVGAQYGGDTFPYAVIVEVPADAKSVELTVAAGRPVLPNLGATEVTAARMTVPLP
ncbi:hypothetical protein [Saccharothrix violaceirubra]|uniref:Uncharacterized protein n=1 Tax=Saccharothrix violaceirubra TaxID=413306 RepID=A0A7W7T858_9PSEU|nr:hypothetical protein [Saccharothrix violaceirubra]MBB4968339.1 hypothetical protein [Saccharothrix violaceirubra]